MASLTITQTSPVINTVSVTQTASPISLEINEQVTQNTVVVSPLNITNYYGGGGEVLAALTGVAPQSTDLGTFAGTIIVDNETIKGALQDLEDGVENNESAINTNAGDITTNANDITSLQTSVGNLTTGALTQALDPTELNLFFSDPGTFTTGTSIESILRQILIHFQPPVLTLSNWTSGIYEHGYAWSDTDFTFSFTNFTNVDATDPGEVAFSDTYIANGGTGAVVPQASSTVSFSRSGDLLVDNGAPAGQSGTALQRSGAAQLTLDGFTDTQGTAIQQQVISSTVRYRYWVLSNTTRIDYGNLNPTNGTALITSSSSLAGTGADTIESNLLSSVSNLTISSAGTYDYVYWIYPTALTVNNINNPLGLPIYTGDQTGSTTAAINYIGTFTLTNQHSADVSMTVLRTKNSGALGSGTYTVS